MTTTRTTLLALLLGLVLPLSAQQVPLFQQTTFFPELSNTARMGDGFLGVNYRQQWTDLGDDAPTSMRLVWDAAHLLNGNQRIGFGLSLLNDQAHIVNRTQASLHFAYRLLPEGDHRLALGVKAGWLSQRLDFADSKLNDGTDLALFSGEASTGGLDGGLGLHYAYLVGHGDLQLDVSLPQLFAADLNYGEDESSPLSELEPHLLSRISYAHDAGNFTVEPIVVYRHFLTGFGVKTGTIDAALKLSLLEHRFWLGGGARFQASTFHVSLGARPLSKQDLQVGLTYEAHQQFGNSFELSVMYGFNQGEKTGLSPYARRVLKSVNENGIVLEEQAESAIQNTDLALRRIQPGMGKDDRHNQVKNAKAHSADASGFVRRLGHEIQNLKQLPAQYQTTEVEASTQKLEDARDRLTMEINALENRIREFEQSTSLNAMLAQGRTNELGQQLQSRLDERTDLPITLLPVEVTPQDEHTVLLTYRFSNTQERYGLADNGMSGAAGLIQHLKGVILEFNREFEVTAIRLNANLLYPANQWSRLSGGSYNGEYDATRILNCYVLNTATAERSLRSIHIAEGDINLEQLTALKLYSIQRSIQSMGLIIPVQLEIIGPSQQGSGQIYSIEVEVRKT